MFTVIITFIIIFALLLILVVLAQNSKGGGLSSQFGGGGTSQVMGVKRTGDFLEKATWVFAIAVLILSLATHVYLAENVDTPGMNSPNLERAEEQTILPPASSSPLPIQSTEPAAEGDAGLDGLVEEENK